MICSQGLRDAGVELIELTPDERAAFAAAAKAEVDKTTRSRFGADLIALFEDDIAQVTVMKTR